MSSTIALEILRYGALEQYTATAVDFEATNSPATTRVHLFERLKVSIEVTLKFNEDISGPLDQAMTQLPSVAFASLL